MFNPRLSYHRAPGSQQRARTSCFNPNTAGNVSKEKPGTKCRNSPAGRNKRGRSLPTTPSYTDTHQVSEGGLRRSQPAVRPGRRGFGGAALPAGAAGPVLTHPSAGGGAARTSAGSGDPSGGSGPAASPGPRNPRTARGERGCCGGGGSPAERPSSRRADPPRRCPAAGQEQGKGKEGKRRQAGGSGLGSPARPCTAPATRETWQ